MEPSEVADAMLAAILEASFEEHNQTPTQWLETLEALVPLLECHLDAVRSETGAGNQGVGQQERGENE